MSYCRATEQNGSSPAPNNINNLLKLSFVLLLLLFLSNGCVQNSSPVSAPLSRGQPAEPVKPLALNLDRTLANDLDQLLNSPEYSQARWGVSVVSLKDNKLIYDHNGDQLFTPASNMKVYTTAVALDLLGADYRWRTSVYSDSQPDTSGTIHGDLVLFGRGAPDLVASNKKDNTNSIEELAKAVAAGGVKHVEGSVVGDESLFRGDSTGEGWQWNDLQWYFGAEASALSVNANSIDVNITTATKLNEQPKVISTDSDGYIQITNNLVTVDRGEPIKIGVKRELSDNNVVVWGQYPIGVRGYGASLAVHRPSLWAAKILQRELKAQGIRVDGDAKFRDALVPERDRFNPDGKVELTSTISKPLAEVVKETNKFSVNLYAELLLRTLGRERAAMLNTDSIPGRELGDDERGVDLIRLWLSKQGIKTSGLALRDGCGLSRLNLVTPQATTELLVAIRKTNSARVFVESLPVAGVDGTLQGRLKDTNGAVVAKTGTLSYDHSLSGYLTSSNGEILAFSIICNDFLGGEGAIRLIDQLVRTIAAHQNSQKPASVRYNAKP
jgi:D-alanyl-D-alanine carboxypeptidase/D-alanyl-D-alanine-endopeptidase (penicillin-binding protein 4)